MLAIAPNRFASRLTAQKMAAALLDRLPRVTRRHHDLQYLGRYAEIAGRNVGDEIDPAEDDAAAPRPQAWRARVKRVSRSVRTSDEDAASLDAVMQRLAMTRSVRRSLLKCAARCRVDDPDQPPLYCRGASFPHTRWRFA